MSKRERPDTLNTISMSEAARMFGVSPESVRLWVKAGKIRGHKVRFWKKPRLLISDVEALKRKREAT